MQELSNLVASAGKMARRNGLASFDARRRRPRAAGIDCGGGPSAISIISPGYVAYGTELSPAPILSNGDQNGLYSRGADRPLLDIRGFSGGIRPGSPRAKSTNCDRLIRTHACRRSRVVQLRKPLHRGGHPDTLLLGDHFFPSHNGRLRE